MKKRVFSLFVASALCLNLPEAVLAEEPKAAGLSEAYSESAEITRTSIADATVEMQPLTYNGSAQIPTMKILCKDTFLEEGTEYGEVNYSDLTVDMEGYIGGGSNGCSSSGSKTKADSTKSPDSTMIQTETKSDGTTIETITTPDGTTVITTPDGTNPNGVITREQLASMLYRSAGSPRVSGSMRFTDAPTVSGYAKDSIIRAEQKGILSGYDNRVDPEAEAERAQVAAMLARYLQNQ